ncbi:single-stranded DNA-binding protein [Patescibacteria group bacterium]
MSVRSLNKIMLIGNLTRDPELRYTPQGTAVCTFGLATNRSWQPSDGSERQEETEFHRIVAWSKLAEICSQILSKGRKAYVEGRIQNRKWQTQEGQDRETTEIVIDSMIALGAPKNGYDNSGSGSYSSAAAPVAESPVEETVVEEAPADLVGDALEAEESKPMKAKKEKEEVSTDDIPF